MRLQQRTHRGRLEALIAEVFPTEAAIGWVHTHDELLPVRVDDGRAATRHGALDAAAGVFSARLGAAGRELRWELTDDAEGDAVVLELIDGSDDGTEVAQQLELTRVLWGTVGELDSGWARLEEARTATIWVPAPDDAAVGKRLGLRTVEIVAETDEMIEAGVSTAGNLAVIEELLVGLTTIVDEEAN